MSLAPLGYYQIQMCGNYQCGCDLLRPPPASPPPTQAHPHSRTMRTASFHRLHCLWPSTCGTSRRPREPTQLCSRSDDGCFNMAPRRRCSPQFHRPSKLHYLCRSECTSSPLSTHSSWLLLLCRFKPLPTQIHMGSSHILFTRKCGGVFMRSFWQGRIHTHACLPNVSTLIMQPPKRVHTKKLPPPPPA